MIHTWLIPHLRPESIFGGEYFDYPDGYKYLKVVSSNTKKDGSLLYEIRLLKMNVYSLYNALNHVDSEILETKTMDFEPFKQKITEERLEYHPVFVTNIERIVRYWNMSPIDAINFQKDLSRQGVFDLIVKKELEIIPSYSFNENFFKRGKQWKTKAL